MEIYADIKDTTFNFKLTNEHGNDIHMSVQGQNSKNSLKEIIGMVKLNKLTICILSIKLK